MGATSTFDAWNASLGGKLPALLRAYRDNGASFEVITRELYKDHGISVSRDTVRRWFARMEAAA